jgi:hypothetical protein
LKVCGHIEERLVEANDDLPRIMFRQLGNGQELPIPLDSTTLVLR